MKKKEKVEENKIGNEAIMSEEQLQGATEILRSIGTHKASGFIILMELDEKKKGDNVQLKMKGYIAAHGTSRASVLKGLSSVLQQMGISSAELLIASLDL